MEDFPGTNNQNGAFKQAYNRNIPTIFSGDSASGDVLDQYTQKLVSDHALEGVEKKKGKAKAKKPAQPNMRITVDGSLADSVTAKDVILAIIGKIGTAGGTGHVIEFAGSVIRGFSMEGRMTVCNMAIEAGARAGMIAPDQTPYDDLANRPMTPKGDHWDRAVAYWQTLPSDDGAVYDVEITLAAEDIAPTVTWGTSPEDALAITDAVPNPDKEKDANKRAKMERAIAYMGLKPGQKLTDIKVDTVFIGSCTNSRIEDLRAAAALAEGRKVADGMRALVVPGSGLVKEQAEAEGLDKVFIDAGFEWREPGCSMCLAMNADKLAEGERCASTSNRNFEGRQGRGGRTHLMSPAMAAAAASDARRSSSGSLVSSCCSAASPTFSLL